ncbi:hypothetical protein Q3W71_30615 [Micromonospora sp. C28SCA-DRY-2]|uniref:hypothetical protein n=1 Tax=Micromonospora sp. C28SCA-DRY-2 TaxID=3059522 RepID=UPI0026752C1F|nr:hypothetical protein [Micromonospora sp. C28SCA-DRY-2]MDO3706031.1 hypothetical protein [Micromonospora sp. C28SCA-DRY-2]
MATARSTPAKGRNTSSKAAIWITWVSIAVVVVGCVIAGVLNNDGDADVTAPTAQQRDDSLAILARSSASQGVCYGWELTDYFSYGDPVSVGSNLGAGVAVEDNPACPRWVQVSARIYYPSESSDSDDNAYVDVTGSADFSSTELLRMESGLERLGVTREVFIDDPGWAVTRAAVMLPLLAAEAGAVQPAAAPTEAATAPSPLPETGSDLWRDRWGYLLAAVGLLLVTALLVTVGVVQRRRQRAQRGAVPAQRAGRAPAASRTSEKA